MENDLSSMLQSILSDPEQMGKVAMLAQSLMGDGASPGQESAPPPPKPNHTTNGLNGLAGMLDGLLSRGGKPTRSTALLKAMRPYMRPEKQEKLDRALRVAGIVHAVQSVMGAYGGEGHGL